MLACWVKQALGTGGAGGSSASQSFLSMYPFFEEPYLKEVIKNYMKINILFTLLLIRFYQVENIKSITYLTVSRMLWVE